MVALNEMRITPGISPISVLLNLLWIIFGGLWMAAGWMIAALIMAITIIGLPWTRAAFNIGVYTLLPFGQKAVSRAEYYGHSSNLGRADSLPLTRGMSPFACYLGRSLPLK